MASIVAKRATVCLPVVASFSGEGTDRNLSLLHNGDDLVRTVADNCDNTIAIVQSVGPVNLEVSKLCFFSSDSWAKIMSMSGLGSLTYYLRS